MAEPELYLFTGPEAGEKNDAINTIKNLARKKCGNAMDEYSYYTADVRIEDVVSQLQNESLFTSATFIVLRNAEQIKTKADIDLIAAWSQSAGKSGSQNTLILVSDENGIDKKLEKAVPSSHKKIFWEMFENRKPQWVNDYFKKNGFSVTPDAVDDILEMVENNTESLKSECSRFFFCFEKGHEVTSSDVEKILAHNREESAFTLFAAMADGSQSPAQRLETSMEILQKIRVSSDSASFKLIAGLTYCFRQLRAWHVLHANGKTPSEAELKSAGFSGKKKEQYLKASRVWGAGSTSSIISLLAKTDMDIRENGTAMEDTRLSLLIYSIVIKNGRYCSEYQYD